MKNQQILIPLAVFILYVLAYTIVFKPSRTIRIASPFNMNFLNLTNMEKYDRRVKSSLHEIKQKLIFRPPFSILPFVRSTAHYTASPTYGIANCEIGKNMCTKMNAIVCYLHDSEGFVAAKRDIAKEDWTTNFCRRELYCKNTPMKLDRMPSEHKTLFIARDPIERFVSGFTDKCIREIQECYGCRSDILCVVEKAYEEIEHYSRNNSILEKIRVLDDLDLSYEGNHFTPMTWHCDLWDNIDQYTFIRYGEGDAFNSTRQDLYEFLKKQGVEQEKIDYIDYGLDAKTIHATKSSDARQDSLNILLNSTKHLELLANMYYYDYLAFGFEPPVNIYPHHWPYFN